MSAKVKVGDSIRPRMPGKYQGQLTPRQRRLAAAIIHRLKRTCEDGCCAGGTFNGATVKVERGAIQAGDQRRRTVERPRAGVGETVYAAIAAGYPFNLRSDRDPDGNVEPEPEPSDGAPSPVEPGDGDGSDSSDSDGADGADGADGGDGDEDAADGSEDASDGDSEDGDADTEPEPKPKPNAARNLLEKLWALRDFLMGGEANVDDVISTRSIANAAKLHYIGGFSDDYILQAATLNWPDTAKARCGVVIEDAATTERRSARPLPSPGPEVRHALFGTVEGLVASGVMALMVGPAGAGKGVLARQVADSLGLPFAVVPLTEGASVSWLLGRHTPTGFIEPAHLKLYRDGGVFLYDELDAADPNMLLVVNEALSNGTLENPLTGETIQRSPSFVPMAAANTYGLGADAMYGGRNRLDGATLDRWRMGRVEVEYDRDVERAIMGVGR